MKMTKEELLNKINESEISDEMKISLMEDISDSYEVAEPDTTAYDELKAKYDELLEKYKARFLSGEEKAEEPEEKEDVEELKEEEVIDVKEI